MHIHNPKKFFANSSSTRFNHHLDQILSALTEKREIEDISPAKESYPLQPPNDVKVYKHFLIGKYEIWED